MIRLVDFTLSLFLMVLLFPLIILISLFIFLESGFPIFFLQPRVGKNGKLFPFLKFRTMFVQKNTNNGDSVEYLKIPLSELLELRNSYKTTKKNDARITQFGKILRRTSLDEIPQLINIFLGQMSFVGPRPDPPIQRADYDEETWRIRCEVKPGLTGLAQISGRSDAGMKSRTENDLLWVKERSLINYIRILLRTPLVLFKNTN